MYLFFKTGWKYTYITSYSEVKNEESLINFTVSYKLPKCPNGSSLEVKVLDFLQDELKEGRLGK